MIDAKSILKGISEIMDCFHEVEDSREKAVAGHYLSLFTHCLGEEILRELVTENMVEACDFSEQPDEKPFPSGPAETSRLSIVKDTLMPDPTEDDEQKEDPK